jgi:WD40 repeat protein
MRTVMSKPVIVLAFVLALASAGSAYGQLRGHGGPVRALAISPDGREAISGSFETTVIRWSLQRNAAEAQPSRTENEYGLDNAPLTNPRRAPGSRRRQRLQHWGQFL